MGLTANIMTIQVMAEILLILEEKNQRKKNPRIKKKRRKLRMAKKKKKKKCRENHLLHFQLHCLYRWLLFILFFKVVRLLLIFYPSKPEMRLLLVWGDTR